MWCYSFFSQPFFLLLASLHTIENEGGAGESPQKECCLHYCDSVSLLRLSEMTAMCCQKSDALNLIIEALKTSHRDSWQVWEHTKLKRIIGLLNQRKHAQTKAMPCIAVMILFYTLSLNRKIFCLVGRP